MPQNDIFNRGSSFRTYHCEYVSLLFTFPHTNSFNTFPSCFSGVRLTRIEGEQCIATDRSYVDLAIVGSGGSSVGEELVGWLCGVWPHSHNDSLLSVSLFLSPSSIFTLFVCPAFPLVSSSRVLLVRYRNVSSRSCQPNSQLY